jgi:probable HAF family extracellular repeat protein
MHSKNTNTSKAGILAGLLFLCLFTASNAFAYDYQITEIQPPAGYTASRATGINNLGEVVGRFYNIDAATGDAVDRQAFVWDKTNGASLLSTLAGETSAWVINDNGFVAGYSYNAAGKQHATLWDLEDGTVDDLGTFRNTSTGAYGESSTAYGINNLDQVVGSADIPNNANSFTPFHAFFNDVNGMVDLGTFTTSQPDWQNGYSIAYDINNKSEIVGIAHDDSWAFLPFFYDDVDGMQPLQRDNAYLTGEWYAVVINDSGLIGGHVIAATNQSFPYYWPNKSSAPVKITMLEGFPYGEIYGINKAGQMVGIMWSSDQAGATERAFIFDTKNGVRDLNNLIEPASGWVLHFARDINDRGQIAGYGELDGLKRGFILSTNAHMTKLQADFNGDGKADILWRNMETGEVSLWLMDGLTIVGTGSIGTRVLQWEIVQSADFDADGKADILWRNTTNGALQVWLMNGVSAVTKGAAIARDLVWGVERVADFNKDGKADILWRHATNGALQVWLMDGVSALTKGAAIARELVWSIESVADFDSDGKADILWRHNTTGSLQVWLMDGASATTKGAIIGRDLVWGIERVADFDGDGNADILCRNTTNGALQVWLMDGVSVATKGANILRDLAWGIERVADFNADGNADILWRYATTGNLQVWLMNGVSVTTKGAIIGRDLVWGIENVVDFSNDGKADILWRNPTDGTLQVWLMDGVSAGTKGATIPRDLEWEIQ